MNTLAERAVGSGTTPPWWQGYRYNSQVRRSFLVVYVIYGGLLALLVLETMNGVRRHNWFGLITFAGGLYLAFLLSRAVYRHVWLFRHR